MNNWKQKIFALAAVTALVTCGLTAKVQAFDEIEDLSRPGAIGNKEIFQQPAEVWEQELIMGEPVATQAQMVAYIKEHNPQPRLNCSVEEIVQLYYEEAGLEGVRADIALCQALKETGFFKYGKDVQPRQNNYCGLGATGNGAPGYSFFSPRRGVRAHIQHLLAYATTQLPKQELVDPRYEVLITRYSQYHGAIQYWTGLNGRWAVPGEHYGQDILAMWHDVLRSI